MRETGRMMTLPNDREKVFADRPVGGQGPAAQTKERQARRPKQNWQLQRSEPRPMLRQNGNFSGHDSRHGKARETGEKPEEQGNADKEFAGEEKSDKKGGPAQSIRRRPEMERFVPSRPAEPTQNALRPVKEKKSGKGHAEDEGAEIPRGMKKKIDGVIRHGDEPYQIGHPAESKSISTLRAIR